MLRKTHLVIGLAVALHFFPHVNNKWLFLPLVLISTLLPDLDNGTSLFGRNFVSRGVQSVTTHRGFFHSYTFCIPASIILTFIYPVAALPFFLGYSFHLLADSFTVRGIRPFWPHKGISKGKIRTGGKSEDIVFWVFVLVDLFAAIIVFL